jgi:putative DNA primase/helicase
MSNDKVEAPCTTDGTEGWSVPDQRGELLQYALRYGAKGLRVFPVCTPAAGGGCEQHGAGCEHPGKVPLVLDWPERATADPGEIEAMWRAWPGANIGIATGEGSNVDVLDVDPEKGGLESMAEVERQYGPLPVTPDLDTGGDGGHMYFRHHPGVRNRAGFRPGLDVRGQGGYVVAPPSKHSSGKQYEWAPRVDLDAFAPADWPDMLLDEVMRKSTTATRRRSSRGATGNPFAALVPVLAIPVGTRNDRLASLAGFLRRGGHSEEQIVAVLKAENVNCEPMLGDAEVVQIAASVARYDPQHPLLASPLTDVGNAQRLVALHEQDLRHAPGLGWLVWDGTRWCPDEQGLVMEHAKNVVQQFALAMQGEPDEESRRKMASWALKSQAEARLNAMINLAASDEHVRATLDQFDTDAYLLNVANGTVDLTPAGVKFYPHRRQDLLTRRANATYEPAAGCPTWNAFIREVMAGRPDLVSYVQRAVGYSLTGGMREHVLFLLLGGGCNGKSTFMNVVRQLLGTYASTAEFSTFLAKASDSVRNDIARLRGVRFVTASEAGSGRRLDEALVKQLTGGDAVTARFLFREYFEYRPQFKLFLAANVRPIIHGADMGIWRRIKVIPFEVNFKNREDRDLEDKLLVELPGILNWALDGLVDYQARGLDEPAEVQTASLDYKEDMDMLLPFLETCCICGESRSATSQELYRAYRAWCLANGQEAVGMNLFGERLGERGFKKTVTRVAVDGVTKQRRGWAGIGVKSPWGRAEEEAGAA